MSLKTIKVNPIFLMGAGGGSGRGEKNKTRKEKPLGVSLGQPNNIKKKLIARIKNFQQEKSAGSNSISNSNSADTTTFMNEFSESVNFLDNLARDKQDHKQVKRNATLKKKQPYNPEAYMQIQTELPPELMGVITPTPPFGANLAQPSGIGFAPKGGVGENPPKGGVGQTQQVASPQWSAPPQPLYSNLKMGGTKPTYRTWLRNTQKNKHVPPPTKPQINILENFDGPIENGVAPPALISLPPSLASVALAQTAVTLAIPTEPLTEPITAELIQTPTVSITAEPIQTQPLMGGLALPPNGGPACVAGGARPRRKKITRTLKYKLGKHANGKVSVLIKNSQTRRRVQTEHSLLKQKSIIDIKNYLRSKNLLKVGSEAPNDVLRHLYEQSILAGQIENKAKDTLIHNYFNTEK
jgi:hypothetical protein